MCLFSHLWEYGLWAAGARPPCLPLHLCMHRVLPAVRPSSLFYCAYASRSPLPPKVFLSALLQPDWDMFHSKHPAARIHAMARWVPCAWACVKDTAGCAGSFHPAPCTQGVHCYNMPVEPVSLLCCHLPST